MGGQLGRLSGSLLGVCACFLLAELVFRQLTPYDDDLTVGTYNDSFYPGRLTIGQISEGIATAHFGRDGRRLTGLEDSPGAPVVLIVGDSHIEAVQVADELTMGADLERISRADGRPLNAVQFGWSAVAAPMYAAVADSLLSAIHPLVVVVLLTDGDLGAEPLVSARTWEMTVGPDTSVTLVPVPPRTIDRLGRVVRAAILARRKSALWHAAQEKILAWRMQRQGPAGPMAASPDTTLVAAGSLVALRHAYGSRLLVLYAPRVPPAGDVLPNAHEKGLLEACAVLEVECISLRDRMLVARAQGMLARGFVNTVPGEGHLNILGHAVAATAIYDALTARGRWN